MRSDHTTVLQTMSGLGAERVLIVEGTQPMQLTASWGLSDHLSWTDQVSVSILEHCFRVGGALTVADAQVEFNSGSVAANGIRSVLCVPILNRNLRIDGLIYADVRAKAGVFATSALERALECARQLQAKELSTEPGESQPLPKGSTPLGVPLLRPAAATNELVPLRQGLMPILAEIGETLIGYGAERVLVVEKVASLGLLFARGLNPDMPWTEQISLTLLKQVLKDGAPLALADAPSKVDAWSVSLIDIRSVICVAYWSSETRVAGVVYADVRNRRGAFQNSATEAAQNCARKLENFLYRGELLAEWEAPEAPKLVVRSAAPAASTRSLGLKSSTEAARPSLPTFGAIPGRRSKSQPRAQSVVMFYRCLATMLGAGLMITRSLDVLTQHSEDPALAAICAELAGQLSSGRPLSRALAAYPQVFRESERHLIQIGEASGTLHRVLIEIADSQEKFQAMEMRLRSALTYPALVSALSLAMLLLGPPYLLQGQFDLIRHSGQTPPLLTQMLMTLSDLMRAIGLPLIIAGLLGTSWLGRVWLARPQSRRRCWAVALRLKGLSTLLNQLTLARFAASLALTYRVGLPFHDCLRLASLATANPVFQDSCAEMLSALKAGGTLRDCLAAAPDMPQSFLQMVSAGEESGKIDQTMEWIARLYEQDLECTLDSVLSMVEPILMLVMGILVGLMLLATLLPMVSVLNNL